MVSLLYCDKLISSLVLRNKLKMESYSGWDIEVSDYFVKAKKISTVLPGGSQINEKGEYIGIDDDYFYNKVYLYNVKNEKTLLSEIGLTKNEALDLVKNSIDNFKGTEKPITYEKGFVLAILKDVPL